MYTMFQIRMTSHIYFSDQNIVLSVVNISGGLRKRVKRLLNIIN